MDHIHDVAHWGFGYIDAKICNLCSVTYLKIMIFVVLSILSSIQRYYRRKNFYKLPSLHICFKENPKISNWVDIRLNICADIIVVKMYLRHENIPCTSVTRSINLWFHCTISAILEKVINKHDFVFWPMILKLVIIYWPSLIWACWIGMSKS